ncbi:MAG: hypothetical protein D6723_02510 [Acidobacteria bacterium]|nr:MAG: hypothetical protein D6723_02510 [Acidobacteriota bacterium]
MRRRQLILFTIIVAFFMLGISAFAGLSVTEQSTKTKGATTVTWDSAFEDLDYTVGTPITMTVTWTADTGIAEYEGFELKSFTPRSKKDPADGTLMNVSPASDGTSVTVEFVFTELHLDRKRNVEVGNAHFKLYLWIDKDGDGAVESVAGYGVNVHVEDPQ